MNYDDIINLPHFHADGRPYMNKRSRAAQFMPFKSLKGFDDMVDNKSVELDSLLLREERLIEPNLEDPVYFEEEIYYD